MSDIQQIDSPNQRYYLLLASNGMRMSHWVTSAALWERAAQRLLLQIGDGLWSSEQIVWSADSRVVTEVARQEGIQRFIVGTHSKETDQILAFYRSHGFTPWSMQFFR